MDRMQESITQSALEDDHKTMLSGLRQLLSILEAMKLDIANHQVRNMRSLLIGDTINFELRYNAHMITLGKLNTESSRAWLESKVGSAELNLETRPDHLETLASSLFHDLLFAPSTTCLVSTFYLDVDRLRAIRLEMHNVICHHICSDILVAAARTAFTRSPNTATTVARGLPAALPDLRAALSAIVGTKARWPDHISNIAAEFVRIVLTLSGHSAQPYDAELIASAERKLRSDFASDSEAFCQHARSMRDRMLPKVKESIRVHSGLPALELQDALVTPLPVASTCLSAATSASGAAAGWEILGFGAIHNPSAAQAQGNSTIADPDVDLVRRFVHVVVLHWQVWADLVYLAPPQEDEEEDTDDKYKDAKIDIGNGEVDLVVQAILAEAACAKALVDNKGVAMLPSVPINEHHHHHSDRDEEDDDEEDVAMHSVQDSTVPMPASSLGIGEKHDHASVLSAALEDAEAIAVKDADDLDPTGGKL